MGGVFSSSENVVVADADVGLGPSCHVSRSLQLYDTAANSAGAAGRGGRRTPPGQDEVDEIDDHIGRPYVCVPFENDRVRVMVLKERTMNHDNIVLYDSALARHSKKAEVETEQIYLLPFVIHISPSPLYIVDRDR